MPQSIIDEVPSLVYEQRRIRDFLDGAAYLPFPLRGVGGADDVHGACLLVVVDLNEIYEFFVCCNRRRDVGAALVVGRVPDFLVELEVLRKDLQLFLGGFV